ncbi:MAG TPA: histidine phosphatase family protein [Actinospica sp.]|nr:histidine phosphatase family protein [Actinospica sp.]
MNAPSTTRTLLILRHAKSDWPDDVADHERPLAERGRRDAPAMGRWLREAGYRPDHVVCSTALRTRQTWELVHDALAADPPIEFEPELYGATVQDLLDVIGRAPADAGSLLVIGHNPGLEYLALTLAGDAPSEDRDRLHGKFPTAALAVCAWEGGWNQAADGSARLVRFVTPHDL